MAKPQHGGLEAANRRIESADHEIDLKQQIDEIEIDSALQNDR